MDKNELIKKIVIAFITALLTGLSAMLTLPNVSITWVLLASVIVTALLGAWNTFLQLYSPTQVQTSAKSSAKRVNWASKLREY